MTQTSITKFLDLSLYLMIATGFLTLATTGKLDPVSLVFVSAALLVRGYLFVRGRTPAIPDRLVSALTIAYVVFYLVDFYFISGTFVSATVHLVLFSMVAKLFSVKRDRDRLYLGVLAFMSVLAAAVLTVDSIFLVSFCVFLPLAVAAFTAFEMKRAAGRAQLSHSSAAPVRPWALSLATTAGGLALAIALGAVLLFFVLPRVSTGYLSAYAPRNQLISGFSDSVRLGQIGEIKQSDAVVMHAQVEGDRRLLADLKWRGVALGIFHQNRWSNPSQPSPLEKNSLGAFELRAPGERRSGAHAVNFRVLMEPIGTNIFFLPPVAASLYGNYSGVAKDDADDVFNTDRERVITEYRGSSDVDVSDPDILRQASGALPPDIALRYLQLPALDPRIPALARQVTAAAANPYDKASRLERFLRTEYGYSLQLPRTVPADPLAEFLFVRKQGHCEYFASAMAIMLRTLGVPSRLVNGFRGGEFNPVTGSYIIRARDAHSWVEAYFPGAGWVSFDPTPPDPRPTASAWNRSMMYLDAMREFWREWVINYDFGHQATLALTARRHGRHALDSLLDWWHSRYAVLLTRARRVKSQVTVKPKQSGSIAVLFVLLTAVAINARRLKRWSTNGLLIRRPQRAPQAAASLWYARMTRALARRGYRKTPAQTPGEFVAAIDEESLRRSVAAFTESYEHARFGASSTDANELQSLYNKIQSASRLSRNAKRETRKL
jgi:transglutaminase-like putative cysteine protease